MSIFISVENLLGLVYFVLLSYIIYSHLGKFSFTLTYQKKKSFHLL